MTQLMAIIGIIGTVLVVGLYLLMQHEKVNPRGFWYSFLNGAGAVMILASISYEFDPGDLGGVLVEVCWASISFYGAWRALGRRSRPPGGGAADGSGLEENVG